jgi:hypothetical protein
MAFDLFIAVSLERFRCLRLGQCQFQATPDYIGARGLSKGRFRLAAKAGFLDARKNIYQKKTCAA